MKNIRFTILLLYLAGIFNAVLGAYNLANNNTVLGTFQMVFSIILVADATILAMK